MKHLILGGARSGKSRFAEQCGLATSHQLHYIATAQTLDEEMTARVAMHRQQRDPRWQLTEAPLQLQSALQTVDGENSCVLVDCLTLWLSNCLAEDIWQEQRALLFSTLDVLQAHILFVSNEVGNGIVPMGQLSRTFVDESGWLHQQLAQRCERVTLVTAGLPQTLKATNELV